KIRSLWLSEPVFSAEDLKKISVPTLVMAGDHDIIRMDHTLAMFQSLHQAQLCILPGTTHRLMKEKPDLVNRVILKFLKEPIFVPMDQSTDSTQKS
ncbi:MAG TPA: alpha/beta hydrolase, partial [Candidatus Omnitrophota bacterium]|nr:alpha/beta hydrolase [Candidatus Omnitrophota bacterium]